MYRECTASFEPKLWNKVIWRSWERTIKTISSRTGKMRGLALHRRICPKVPAESLKNDQTAGQQQAGISHALPSERWGSRPSPS